jgi:hypothetical protein
MRRATNNEYGMALERFIEMSERIAGHEDRLRELERNGASVARAEHVLRLMRRSRRVLQRRLALVAKERS